MQVKSTADEMTLMMGQVDELRTRVVALPPSEIKNRLLEALDKWKQDVNAIGIMNFKFFDTVPFCDRLQAIGGVFVNLQSQIALSQ